MGIKLPGRNQELLTWKGIDQFSLKDSTVTLEYLGNTKNVNIDKRDQGDIKDIIEVWKNNCS